ncbi:uncharacterized protein LAESUDRAFT_728906 [Laetiporus sulphureus 93-53]|uniref:Uncharacterized protein n=1 Tax=Laetiporus sulphureus 93-53 TaxID=1314785 RepID=A0A165CX21_9APHY|nr:uncharacterized protein LAESUDRAFT_728906 [Laetiporus sulphureus 93-53]KZT03628.1 hypothetical protein LAESUDRAFT_728906 [Laetiporus sulphureus 93-53]
MPCSAVQGHGQQEGDERRRACQGRATRACNRFWPSLAAHFVDCCIRTANLSPGSPYTPGIHASREIDGILGANRAIERRLK